MHFEVSSIILKAYHKPYENMSTERFFFYAVSVWAFFASLIMICLLPVCLLALIVKWARAIAYKKLKCLYQ